jgi:hypothetical protein
MQVRVLPGVFLVSCFEEYYMHTDTRGPQFAPIGQFRVCCDNTGEDTFYPVSDHITAEEAIDAAAIKSKTKYDFIFYDVFDDKGNCLHTFRGEKSTAHWYS